jgi:hypothetical protein
MSMQPPPEDAPGRVGIWVHEHPNIIALLIAAAGLGITYLIWRNGGGGTAASSGTGGDTTGGTGGGTGAGGGSDTSALSAALATLQGQVDALAGSLTAGGGGDKTGGGTKAAAASPAPAWAPWSIVRRIINDNPDEPLNGGGYGGNVGIYLHGLATRGNGPADLIQPGRAQRLTRTLSTPERPQVQGAPTVKPPPATGRVKLGLEN